MAGVEDIKKTFDDMSVSKHEDADGRGNKGSSDSEQSGDEPEDELWDTDKHSDDVDAFPFTKLYRRLIGKSHSRKPTKPMPQSPKRDNPDRYIYDFSHPNRGLAVIINNERFQPGSQMSTRHGSHYDANDLELVFKRMGFRVKRYNDLTGAQMVLKLKKIAANLKYDHSLADCFACAILSHGEAIEVEPDKPPYDNRERLDVVFGVDGVIVPTKYILSLFSDRYCPELEGKPRLFFIQACRGMEYDDGAEIRVWKQKKKDVDEKRKRRDKTDGQEYTETTSHENNGDISLENGGIKSNGQSDTTSERQEAFNCGEIDECDAGVGHSDITVSPSPIYKDFLVMYSCPPGYFAWRRSTGAWFIQSLKRVLLSCDLTATPLTKLLTRVNRLVALGYESQSSKEYLRGRKKQVPCLMSMLTKEVYFLPKK